MKPVTLFMSLLTSVVVALKINKSLLKIKFLKVTWILKVRS